MSHGNCIKCRAWEYLRPLHGENGGPGVRLMCLGRWHGEHGKRRKTGLVVIRAMQAFLEAGGRAIDLETLRGAAVGSVFGMGWIDPDPLGYLHGISHDKMPELTLELLSDAIRLAHPDMHPPDRKELAQRATQGLNALKPYVFPANVPKPPSPTATTMKPTPTIARSHPAYPCKQCADTVPLYYCTPCRTDWESRRQKERDERRAKQRKQYSRRKELRDWRKPAAVCASCGNEFQGKRTDARFCSATCRKRASRINQFSPARTEIAVTEHPQRGVVTVTGSKDPRNVT